MAGAQGKRFSRRSFLKLTAVAACAGPFFLYPGRSFASQKTLKIAKWAHFVPDFDVWFESAAKEWGTQHEMQVSVDIIPLETIGAAAKAEVQAGSGHDVFIFPWPPAEYYRHAIDHGAIYQMVAAKYGAIQQLAHRSTFHLKSKKYFAFADFWVPFPLHFFQDYWAEAGMPLGPVHFGSLRSGGKSCVTNWEFRVACRFHRPWKAISRCIQSSMLIAPGCSMDKGRFFSTRMSLPSWR